MSGLEFLLDTNMVIGLLKGHPEVDALLEREGVQPEDCAVSQITRMELLSFPKLESAEESAIKEFLGSTPTLILTPEIEEKAIAFRRKHGTKLPDAIVAATAQAHSLGLITLDRRLGKQFEPS